VCLDDLIQEFTDDQHGEGLIHTSGHSNLAGQSVQYGAVEAPVTIAWFAPNGIWLFTVEGYTPQSHLNRVNLGVSHNLTKDLALRASYSIRKDDDFTQQGINLGVALDF